jgi:hypothetical protein
MAASASIDWRVSPRWTLSGSAGGTFAGRLTPPAGARALGGGGVVSLGASVVPLEEKGWIPFILISAALSFSGAQGDPAFYGTDARLGVAVGYTFFGVISPYVTGRVFGGPAIWGSQIGTDVNHYQVGVGLIGLLPAGFDLSAEFVPLGEQRLAASVGYSF